MVFSHLVYSLLSPLDDVGVKDLSFSCLIPEYGHSAPSTIQHLKRCHFQSLLIPIVMREFSIGQAFIPTSTIL
jgi:hypothetical protein